MSQEQSEAMPQSASLADPTGYFTSKYSWEEVEAILDWAKQQMGG